MANWPDAMRVISDETQSLIDGWNDGGMVGGMGWDEGANEVAIEALLARYGLELSDEGYAVLAEDADEDDDSIAGDEDELSWCSTCQEWTLMTPLTDDISEEPIDPDFPMLLCEGCGYTTPAGYEPEPEPYIQHTQCSECKGEMHTLPPDERVPATVGTVWSCDMCRHVRLVPVMTPLVAAKHLLWGVGEWPPHQWHLPVVAT